MADGGRLRIGALSRRVGESPELLRAWETRYGLVSPARTPGGLRLYSAQDEQRIRAMRRHIDGGLTASEAARLAILESNRTDQTAGNTVHEMAATLERSFDALDEPAAQAALDRLLATVGLRRALAEVILPLLRQVGDRWAAAQLTVAQEHFISNITSGRLRRLAEGWGGGIGPHAILACPPGELHEIGLLSFGLALNERGWRITYFGADTPLGDIETCLDDLSPTIIVLAAASPTRFRANADAVKALAAKARVGIAGAGASHVLATKLGAEYLAGGITDVAASLTP